MVSLQGLVLVLVTRLEFGIRLPESAGLLLVRLWGLVRGRVENERVLSRLEVTRVWAALRLWESPELVA